MSFRLKTILGIAAIEAVLLALLIFTGLRWLHDSNEDQLLQRALTTARLFATTTQNAVLATDLASLDSFVAQALTNEDLVYARVRDGQGRILAEGGRPEALRRPFLADHDPSQARDGVFDTFAEIRVADTGFGRVELGLSVLSFHSLMSGARSAAIGIALLEMLLVALFSFVLGTYLTRQLQRLRDAAALIAEEGPGFSIPVKGQDEVAQAIRAFNHMSSRLAEARIERQHHEEELRLAAQAIETQEAIVITDADAVILRVNRAFTKITGYAAADVIGQTPRILKSGRHGPEFYRDMWNSLLEQGYWSGEIDNRRKDGVIYPERLSISAVRDQADRVTHFVAHFVDISEQRERDEVLRQARLRAEQATEAKSRFLATMSHEIRTPLNGIINMNDLLLETALDATQRDYAQTASEAGRNLLAIVNSILDFSKIEAGRVEPHPEPVDPQALVASVVRLFGGQAYGKGIVLTIFCDPQTPRLVRIDPGLLRQVLLNLVGNAVKFTDHGGVRVRLQWEVAGDGGSRICCEVIDTGIGIAQAKQTELFQEFSQVDGSATRRFGGTGLGLAISRSLTEILGGAIGCVSELGVGSRFWVRLPVAEPEPAPAPPLEPPPVIAQTLKTAFTTGTIHVFSRSPLLREELALQLQAAGLAVQAGEPTADLQPNLASGAWMVVIAVCTSGSAPDPLPADARLLVLRSPGRIVAEQERDTRVTAEGRVPIAPDELYRLLWKVVSEAGKTAAGESAPPPESPQESPQASPQASPPPASGTQTRAPADAAPILLVEDVEVNRKVATAILSKAGYRVVSANNGLEALAAVTDESFGLILMDIAMPVMDGHEATRRIRALPGKLGRIPIVAMTAGTFDDDRQVCLALGMNDFLAKPVVKADLLAAVRRWLSSHDDGTSTSPNGVVPLDRT